MKQAIVNFCKSTDTGLFLLDMPTGFGKTYSVLEFMVDYYDSPEFKDKKIFFVTTLKKNLPDKELREHFAKRGKADDYDKYCLRIEANADMVVEKLDELYRARKIPAAITMKQEFKDLHGSVKLLNEYRDKKRELKGTSKDIINVLCKNAEDAIRKQQEGAFRKVIESELKQFRTPKEKLKNIVKKEVLNSGINIVDAVHTETSEDYLQDVADGINKIIPEAKCSVGKRLSKKKLNVRYIHDKSFYSDSEVDPHQESMEDYVVQHITVENFKHQSSAAVYNILKELVIKKDIAIGKITLVDWSQYGYKADWLFGVVVDGTYYFMTIHPDGSFKIEALKRNLFTMTEYDKYMDYFGLNEENKNDYRGVIGLVKDAEGNINLIKDTNMYSMPDYTAMGDVLKNVASEGRFPGKDVVTWLRLVMDTTDKIKVHAELDIVIPHIDVNAEYTKANVMGLFKGITTKKEVVRYVFENTGIMLYAYLRGEEERREYLSGNIDINYFDYDDTHAKYSVGEIGNGMKYTIERASVVREIQAVEGSKLIFKKVLPLMGVEFVRYGMLTVVPFPFKYLREYIVKEEKSV